MKRQFSLLFGFLTFASTLTSIGIPQKAEAASCTFPPDITLAPGDGKIISHKAVGFAQAYYYLSYSVSGDLGLFAATFVARPGLITSAGEAFFGNSATLKTGFIVPDEASSGQQATISEKVVDSLGRTICEGSFTITAQ